MAHGAGTGAGGPCRRLVPRRGAPRRQVGKARPLGLEIGREVGGGDRTGAGGGGGAPAGRGGSSAVEPEEGLEGRRGSRRLSGRAAARSRRRSEHRRPRAGKDRPRARTRSRAATSSRARRRRCGRPAPASRRSRSRTAGNARAPPRQCRTSSREPARRGSAESRQCLGAAQPTAAPTTSARPLPSRAAAIRAGKRTGVHAKAVTPSPASTSASSWS